MNDTNNEKIDLKNNKDIIGVSLTKTKTNIIEVKNLNLFFKNKRKSNLHVIRGVDLIIPKGKIVALVGESGSGKSVTAKSLINMNSDAIVSFDYFRIGNETFTNANYPNKNKPRRNKIKIAYTPQNPMMSLNPSRKIWKHMVDVMELRKDFYQKEMTEKQDELNKRISEIESSIKNETNENKIKLLKSVVNDFIKAKTNLKAFMKYRALNILEVFKINNPEYILEAFPHQLSGGMKQRVIIATSILSGAEVIIADEPTTALDPVIQSSVLRLFQDINEQLGITIIFISHNIAVVAKLVDYVYVLYAGRVVEKAPSKIIFNEPRHPYTWALINSIPIETDNKADGLDAIEGTPPDLYNLTKGDPFATRNPYAMAIDYEKEPNLFKVSENHFAATWLLHPSAPKVEIPNEVKKRLKKFKVDKYKESRHE